MVDATFDLLRLCVELKVRKVVMASSASIYGMAEGFPTTEDAPPYNNRTLYGAAKSFGEGLLRSFNDMYGLDYVALRYFNVYGPRMDIHGRYTEVMVRWMERLEAGLPPIIFGDGLQTMDMIHVRDIARANILAAKAAATRRGLQRRQRDRDLAPRPRARARPRHGPARPRARPRGRARRQSGAAPPRLRRRRGRRLGFRPTIALRDGHRATSSTGGAPRPPPPPRRPAS